MQSVFDVSQNKERGGCKRDLVSAKERNVSRRRHLSGEVQRRAARGNAIQRQSFVVIWSLIERGPYETYGSLK
jgi:hypothetical protein